MKEPPSRAVADPSAVADYKRVLQEVLENRPAGTRLRLAEALGKNRSFISQITNPGYSVPIPAAHVERIFEICHFLASEKAKFMDRSPAPDTRGPPLRSCTHVYMNIRELRANLAAVVRRAAKRS